MSDEEETGMVKYGFTLPKEEKLRRQRTKETISPESIVSEDRKERDKNGISGNKL